MNGNAMPRGLLAVVVLMFINFVMGLMGLVLEIGLALEEYSVAASVFFLIFQFLLLLGVIRRIDIVRKIVVFMHALGFFVSVLMVYSVAPLVNQDGEGWALLFLVMILGLISAFVVAQLTSDQTKSFFTTTTLRTRRATAKAAGAYQIRN